MKVGRGCPFLGTESEREGGDLCLPGLVLLVLWCGVQWSGKGGRDVGENRFILHGSAIPREKKKERKKLLTLFHLFCTMHSKMQGHVL